MNSKNPLCCKTCGNNPSLKGLDFDSCPLWAVLNDKYSDESRDYKIQLLGSFLVTTKYTGCASHTAAKSEQEIQADAFELIDEIKDIVSELIIETDRDSLFESLEYIKEKCENCMKRRQPRERPL